MFQINRSFSHQSCLHIPPDCPGWKIRSPTGHHVPYQKLPSTSTQNPMFGQTQLSCRVGCRSHYIILNSYYIHLIIQWPPVYPKRVSPSSPRQHLKLGRPRRSEPWGAWHWLPSCLGLRWGIPNSGKSPPKWMKYIEVPPFQQKPPYCICETDAVFHLLRDIKVLQNI